MSWVLEQQSEKLNTQQSKNSVSKAPANHQDIDDSVTGEQDVWQVQAKADWARLKSIKDHDERHSHNPAVLNNYRDYLSDYIKKDKSEQNKVLVMNIIWAVDCGEYKWALELAKYAVRNAQKSLFGRDIQTFVADAILQEADKRYKVHPLDLSMDSHLMATLYEVDSGRWVLNPHDIIRAKLHRQAGLNAERDGDYTAALKHYKTAQNLKNDIGCKGRIIEMQKHVTTP